MERVRVTLVFSVNDEELAKDFLDSPILLPHTDIIKKAYKESFDLDLVHVDYMVEDSGRVYTAPLAHHTLGPPKSSEHVVTRGYVEASIAPPGATLPTPAAAPMVKHPTEPPTEAQMSYLNSLAESHDVGLSERDAKAYLVDLTAKGVLNRGKASEFINAWKAKPRRPKTARSKSAAVPVPEGYYKVAAGGATCYYRVRKAKTAPFHTYADILTTDPDGSFRWKYVRGAVGTLGGSKPITYAEASRWGIATSHCIVCHAKLTDPDSVARGIGPVCAKNFK